MTSKSVGNPTPQTELKVLTPNTVQVDDLPRFPHMTGWFEPLLLIKLLWRVIISDVFGQYADRRLMEAALDPVLKSDQQVINQEKSQDKTEIWIDYVADLGDGFDATYAIAYLLAQPSLTIEGEELPRGDLLVMGGDEVYPTSSRDNYSIKMRLPYSFALPDAKGEKIPLFLLPGNHDWYDGLISFLAIFCREKPTRIGSWRTHQRRSYFVAKLTNNWWIWGIDIALVRDMDQPQADYFVGIAKCMPKHSNIILCSAEPGWYSAEKDGNSFRTLSYAAWIAERAKIDLKFPLDLKIPLVLSGDSHHYARYSGSEAQFITSGGGGAFLHGTLNLKDKLKFSWLKDSDQIAELKCCYPSKENSNELLDGNRNFGSLNPGLTLALSLVYLACAFILTSVWRWDVGIAIFAVLFGGLYGYARYQEGTSREIMLLSGIHAAAHMAVIAGLSGLALLLNNVFFDGYNWHWLLWLLILAIFALTGGRWLSGKIFGWNLLITCRHFGLNNNDAFSAMKLDSHKNFLRIHICGDTLTVYPIKLDEVPRRDMWHANPKRKDDLSASVFIADPEMTPKLIEKAIVIETLHARSMTEV